MNKKRTFKKSEKLAILKEASEQGVKPTLAKHGLYPATYYSWRKKFNPNYALEYLKGGLKLSI